MNHIPITVKSIKISNNKLDDHGLRDLLQKNKNLVDLNIS
jgi:hypothetical protein